MKRDNLIHYKGYSAKPEYSAEDKIFYGVILGIDDAVDFYSDSAGEIENEFHKAVDDYISFCEEIGKDPQKEYSGSFNVRISPELHRKTSIAAKAEGVSMNTYVSEALEYYSDAENKKTVAV